MVLINGIDLLDNSDGLSAATVLVLSLGASGISIVFGQELISLLGLALVGVCRVSMAQLAPSSGLHW